GTTHTLSFHITNEEIDFNNIKEAWISLKNKEIEYTWKMSAGRVMLNTEKKLIFVDLTQEETLSFSDDKAFTQLRLLLNNDTALASEINIVRIKKILKDGVIELPEEPEPAL
ncbi:MAG: hypothetical protein J6T34_01240, partial [Bacilli bacterium]|nr:hypothetical protein [Bacilli bacterium]